MNVEVNSRFSEGRCRCLDEIFEIPTRCYVCKTTFLKNYPVGDYVRAIHCPVHMVKAVLICGFIKGEICDNCSKGT